MIVTSRPLSEATRYYDAKARDAQPSRFPYERYRYERITDEILSLTPRGQGLRALDLGCGLGGLTSALLDFYEDRQLRLVGMDFSTGMARAAKRRLPSLDFVVGDAHRVPFKDHVFDMVAAREVLEHLEDPVMALKEARRTLRKGGFVIASTPSWFGLVGPFYFVKKQIGMQPKEAWWSPFSLVKAFQKAYLLEEKVGTVNPTPYHGFLWTGLIPVVRALDSKLEKKIALLGRTIIIRARK